LVAVVLTSAHISLTTKLFAALRKVIETLYGLDAVFYQVDLFLDSKKNTYQAQMALSGLQEQICGLVELAKMHLQKASLGHLTILADVM
jgi:hypothetical protein